MTNTSFTIYTFICAVILIAGSSFARANSILPVRIENQSAIIQVDTFSDEDNGYLGGGSGISLREALKYADQGTIIILESGRYSLTGDRFTGLEVRNELILKGAGIGKTIIDGNSTVRPITVHSTAHFIVSDVSIQGGKAIQGGALFNEGSVDLYSVSISNSRADDGGALYNQGTLELQNCIVSDNNAAFYGGGIFNDGGSVNMHNVALLRNSAEKGGGLYNQFGMSILYDVTIYGNVAGSGGGISDYFGLVELANSSASHNYGGNFEGKIITLGSNYDSDGSSGFGNSGFSDIIRTSNIDSPIRY
jgi:hypothetical protein